MSAIYPYRWAAQFSDVKAISVAKREWYEGLKDLSMEQLKHGFDHIRKKGGEFPPSIPEFRKACMPSAEELGIMPVSEALIKFFAKDFSNPMIESVYKKIGSWDYQHLTTRELTKQFTELYKIEVDKMLENKTSVPVVQE